MECKIRKKKRRKRKICRSRKKRAKRPDPPYKLQIYKGYKNVMIRKDFAEFLIYHPVAKAFEEYLTNTIIPDEHLYATMSRIQNIEEKLSQDCGKNKAASCDACPKDNGTNWCAGDCVLKNEKCVLRMKSKSSFRK